MANETTPMMKQFYELKEKHPDALILFRCGDFYETYADDAKTASEILGITLTQNREIKNHIGLVSAPHRVIKVSPAQKAERNCVIK